MLCFWWEILWVYWCSGRCVLDIFIIRINFVDFFNCFVKFGLLYIGFSYSFYFDNINVVGMKFCYNFFM